MANAPTEPQRDYRDNRPRQLKTRAEYQREYRDRKAAQLEKLDDQTESFMRKPFSDFLDEADVSDLGTVDTLAAHCGITCDWPADDSDIDFSKVGADFGGFEPNAFGKHGNSLARAERMLTTFRHGYSALANLIHQYKREELQARIAELEASDLSDPTLRKAALANLVKLNKLLERLDKEVRFTYPATEIKG